MENKNISLEQLEAFDASFAAQRANRVAMNAVTNNGLLASAIQRGAVENDVHEYSICLKQGDICNQKQSGRCWMFAALNTLRYQVMKKYDLKTFELSQAYLFFWDKLEKSNYFLESILETLDEPTGGRLVSYLLTSPVGDGGQRVLTHKFAHDDAVGGVVGQLEQIAQHQRDGEFDQKGRDGSGRHVFCHGFLLFSLL